MVFEKINKCLSIPNCTRKIMRLRINNIYIYSVFGVRAVFSCCIVVAMAKQNLIKTPAFVSLANFQRSQML